VEVTLKGKEESKTLEKIKASLNELYEILFAAWDCYQLWWIFASKEERHKHMAIYLAHRVFFETASNACFSTVIVNLYKLCETRNDTINIDSFLKDARKGGLISEEITKCLWEQCGIVKETRKKISILRSNWFAHQSKMQIQSEIFKLAKITPNQIKAFMEQAGKILNEVAKQLSAENRPLNDSVGQQTQILLETLKGEKK
jgi:hypothetical protein